VRALAVRSVAQLDHFEPLLDALTDDRQKSFWDDHFNELQQALARGPATAREVHLALEKTRGRETAAQLYRNLWSYSPDDLAAGGAATLVEQLQSESLDMRVVAIENLQRITGMTHLYRPDVNEARRIGAHRRWQASLAEGQIKYAQPVLILPPRN
jgi:hypothetical protein